MSTIRVTIDTGNAAMLVWHDVAEAIGRALDDLPAELEPIEGEQRSIRDANGNTVGSIEVEAEQVER